MEDRVKDYYCPYRLIVLLVAKWLTVIAIMGLVCLPVLYWKFGIALTFAFGVGTGSILGDYCRWADRHIYGYAD